MTLATIIIRLFLSIILIRAALHKIHNRKVFQMELSAYQLLPASLLSLSTFVLMVTEAFTAITLLNSAWIIPALISAVLFSIYAIAMAINLLKGRTNIDCGCSGPILSSTERAKKNISWLLVFRNLILSSLALFCTTTITIHIASTLELFIIAAGTAVTLLLYETIEQAIINTQGYQRWKH
jgi:hypothetical protein